MIHWKLLELEGQHKIDIIYACESGSRAWGFESTDSDYDVRFIYVHREQDYYLDLNIENKKSKNIFAPL